jgi:hypothetical protein
MLGVGVWVFWRGVVGEGGKGEMGRGDGDAVCIIGMRSEDRQRTAIWGWSYFNNWAFSGVLALAGKYIAIHSAPVLGVACNLLV